MTTSLFSQKVWLRVILTMTSCSTSVAAALGVSFTNSIPAARWLEERVKSPGHIITLTQNIVVLRYTLVQAISPRSLSSAWWKEF